MIFKLILERNSVNQNLKGLGNQNSGRIYEVYVILRNIWANIDYFFYISVYLRIWTDKYVYFHGNKNMMNVFCSPISIGFPAKETVGWIKEKRI